MAQQVLALPSHLLQGYRRGRITQADRLQLHPLTQCTIGLTQTIVADMSGVPCHAHSVDSELLVLTPEKLLLVCTLQTALEPTLQVGPCAAAVLMVPQIVQSMDAELLVLTLQ